MCPARGKARHTYEVYPKHLEHLQGCRVSAHCAALPVEPLQLLGHGQDTHWDEAADNSLLKGLNIEKISSLYRCKCWEGLF